ncbi:hypothetical protein PV328_001026 [Microctonus aethiopoides]|uniref:Uncharacterized protein n=1 Tax=Microctonus aethiopoides TaxID=144406 RepID=A0AA39FWB9_9HYME|nr:hypothetical protein PV328_001026 [Microctonus aethiopoides]
METVYLPVSVFDTALLDHRYHHLPKLKNIIKHHKIAGRRMVLTDLVNACDEYHFSEVKRICYESAFVLNWSSHPMWALCKPLFFISESDSPDKNTSILFETSFPDTARSPDLSLLDFFLWGYLKGKVYHTKPREEELRKRIINACVDIPPRMVESAMENFYLRLCQCQERHLAVSGKDVSNKIDVFLSGESDSEKKNEGLPLKF